MSAELQSAKENLQVIGTEEEIARLYANAIILLNVTLRQAVQDLRLELSREKDGAQMQSTQTQRETIWDLPKKEAPRNDLKDADTFAASAYGRIACFENASAEHTQDLGDVQDEGILQRENESLIAGTLRPKESRSIAVEVLNRQVSNESQACGFFD